MNVSRHTGIFLIITLLTEFSVLGSAGDAIEGEYMVLLKSHSPSSSLGDYITGLMEIITEEPMGEYTYLHIRMREEFLQVVANHPLVETIEQDRTFYRDPDPAKPVVDPYDGPRSAPVTVETPDGCKRQYLVGRGQNYGLIRTSTDNLPTYYIDDYYSYYHTGKGVDIYIIDSGIDIHHEEVEGRASHGFVSAQLAGEGFTDLDGHGTNVACLAGGTTFGMAKGSNLINVKVLGANGKGSWSGITSGVEYVTNRVKGQKHLGHKVRAVINMSLGGFGYSTILSLAINSAIKEGIIVIVAAGNKAVEAASYFPAGFDDTISVGAIDSRDNFADFSNWGEMVDISAPGVSMYGAWSTNATECTGRTPHKCYVYASGTSMAAPLVTGVVARYFDCLTDEEMESVDQEMIKQMLINTASKGNIKYSSTDQNKTPNRIVFRECSQGCNMATSVVQKLNLRSTAFYLWIITVICSFND